MRFNPLTALFMVALTLGCTDSGVNPEELPDPVAWKDIVTYPSVGGGTCGLQTDGRLYCWEPSGREGYVAGDLYFTALTGDWQFCALSTAGTVHCGSASTVLAEGLTQIPGNDVFRQISRSLEYGCGITLDGRTLCWHDDQAPAPLPGDPGLASVSAVGDNTGSGCGVTQEGVAYCWGDNSLGQLGDGTLVSRSSAAPVSTTERFAEVHATYFGACGLTTEGVALCWGGNHDFQLGVPGGSRGDCVDQGFDSSRNNWCTTPQQAAPDYRFSQLSLSAGNSCGLAIDGTVHCWGSSFLGSLGAPIDVVVASPGGQMCRAGGWYPCTPAKIAVLGGHSFVRVIGRSLRCGLDEQGAAYCWGPLKADGTPIHPNIATGDDAGIIPPVRLREPVSTSNTAG